VGMAEAGRRDVELQREALKAARARERQLRAQLKAAKTHLGYTEIRAPLDGVVLTKNVESGEVVSPGTPVVTVANLDEVWMNIYVPETQTGLIKLNQAVDVALDSFPGETFQGKVTFVSSKSEFTPKTINTPEERVKLVYRVKVSIPNTQQRLKPGMPADAAIRLN
jgi:HlyD family secretion protein